MLVLLLLFLLGSRKHKHLVIHICGLPRKDLTVTWLFGVCSHPVAIQWVGQEVGDMHNCRRT